MNEWNVVLAFTDELLTKHEEKPFVMSFLKTNTNICTNRMKEHWSKFLSFKTFPPYSSLMDTLTHAERLKIAFAGNLLLRPRI